MNLSPTQEERPAWIFSPPLNRSSILPKLLRCLVSFKDLILCPHLFCNKFPRTGSPRKAILLMFCGGKSKSERKGESGKEAGMVTWDMLYPAHSIFRTSSWVAHGTPESPDGTAGQCESSLTGKQKAIYLLSLSSLLSSFHCSNSIPQSSQFVHSGEPPGKPELHGSSQPSSGAGTVRVSDSVAVTDSVAEKVGSLRTA